MLVRRQADLHLASLKTPCGGVRFNPDGSVPEALLGSHNHPYVNLIRTNEPHVSGENINFVKRLLCKPNRRHPLALPVSRYACSGGIIKPETVTVDYSANCCLGLPNWVYRQVLSIRPAYPVPVAARPGTPGSTA